MAGEWIKMRGNLWDDPRVGRIGDMTGTNEAAVIGALYWLWATADQHTEDGCMPGLSMQQIDRKTGVKGFAAALVDVGWLVDDAHGVVIQHFEEHNGASAKKRAQTAKRVANWKSGNASETLDEREGNAASVSQPLAREEKKEEIPPIAPQGGQDRPDIPCPYSAIVALYHEHLPSLPRAKLMPPARQRAMRKAWGWVLSSTTSDGNRRASTADEALHWLAGYFARANDNDFLMGRTPRSAEHKDWRCDIDFLLTDRGMRHVIERTQDAA